MELIKDLSFAKCKNKVTGIWCCDIKEKGQNLKNNLTKQMEMALTEERKTFVLPFLGYGNTFAMEIALEFKKTYYTGLIGILPYQQFVCQHTNDGDFWFDAYNNMDWCHIVDNEPCKNAEETYKKCASGMQKVCKHLIVGYAPYPDMLTFEWLMDLSKSWDHHVKIVSAL